MRQRILKLLITIVLLLNAVVSNVYSADYSSSLGTNKALGSPLLNSNFSYDDWDSWEVLAFGVFISNFVTPVMDDYESAFSTSSTQGTKGKGLQALVFGSGSDSTLEQSLKSLLQYSIAAQKNGSREIKVVYTDYVDGQASQQSEIRSATVSDLFISLDNTGLFSIASVDSILNGKSSVITSTTTTTENNVGITKIQNASLGKLVVSGSQGQQETVFNCADSWDIQMLGAVLSSLAKGSYRSETSTILSDMIKSNTPLVLDIFGNICANYNGRLVVLFPASANQYLTSTPSYNLLNSVIFNETTYASGSSNDMLNNSLKVSSSTSGSRSYNNGLTSVKADGTIQDLDILVYFDTLSELGSTDGQALSSLISSNLTTDGSKVGLRIQVIGQENTDGWVSWNDGVTYKLAQNLAKASDLIFTLSPTNSNAKILSTLITDNGDIDLFGSHVYAEVTQGNINFDKLLNSALKYVDGSSQGVSSGIDLDTNIAYKNKIISLTSLQQVMNLLLYDKAETGSGIDTISPMAKNYLTEDSSLHGIAQNTLKGITTYTDLISKSKILTSNPFILVPLNVVGASGSLSTTQGTPERSGRYVKLFVRNNAMVNAMNVLSVKEGTEFSVWTRYLYITYLDWFGLLRGTSHNFNEHLFDGTSDILNVNAEELFSGLFLTEEEKKAEIQNNTYLLLSQDEQGRKYRLGIGFSFLNDLIVQQYEKVVYADSITSSSSSVTTSISNGFLKIDGFTDNPFTSWFVSNYNRYAIYMVAGLSLILVLITIINRKKITWLLINLVVGVNIILFIPMVSEIPPYLINNTVQKMFSADMTYWAMSESINNAKIEAEYVSEDNTNDIIRMLNIIQLDKSIMLKFDISKKVIEDSSGLLNQIQSLTTTRWLLPTLMRQFSADDGSANYVYQSLGDVFNNMSNLYWLYNYTDSLNYNTATSSTIQERTDFNDLSLLGKRSLYSGYVDTGNTDVEPNYTTNTADYMSYTWDSVSRVKDDTELVHTGFYLLDGISVPDANGDFDSIIDNSGIATDFFLQRTLQLETISSQYNVNDGAYVDYGYLWFTESPLYYFYNLVKDTFDSNRSVGGLAGDLQGFYDISETTGEEVRHSFMHYRDTGYTRDILDLKELFTNAVPYVYTLQVIAGGEDGTKGLLGGLNITENSTYEDNAKSWLYRSNWVTKLMENTDLTRATTVRGSNNEKYKIDNPLLPSSYPEERPMIFSEAQMYSMGLTRSDLSLAELKMVDINKEVERTWTLLLNYVNVSNITTEVFYRQMAVESLLIFNNAFNTTRTVSASKSMYPIALDLRNLSFDSIMKMLMISSTKNVSNMYSNTMQNVVESCDTFSGLLLLATAWVSVTAVPFMRNLLLAFIFYLGIFLFLWHMVSRSTQKVALTVGFVVCNLIFLLSTLLYYGVFALLINTSTADSVLSIGNTAVDLGSPVMVFIVVLVASSVYLVGLALLFRFIFKNTYTVGGTVIMDKIESVTYNIRNRGVSSSDSYSHNSTTNKSTVNNSTMGGIEPSRPRTSNEQDDREFNSSYKSSKSKKRDNTETNTKDMLNKEIEKGKETL